MEAMGHEVTWRTYKDYVFFTVCDPDGNQFEVIEDRA